MSLALNGNPVLTRAAEPGPASINVRHGMFQSAYWSTLAAISDNHASSIALAERAFAPVLDQLSQADAAISAVEEPVAGEARWTPGRIPQL